MYLPTQPSLTQRAPTGNLPVTRKRRLLGSFSHPVRQWAWSARAAMQYLRSSVKQLAGRPAQSKHPPSPRALPVSRQQYITHSDQNTSLSVSLPPLSLPGWNLQRRTHRSGSFRRFLFTGAPLPLGAQLLNLLREASDQSFQMAHTALQAAEVGRRCRHSGERRKPVF